MDTTDVEIEDSLADGSAKTDIYDSRKELESLIVRLRAKNVTENACRDVLNFVHSFSTNAIKEYQKCKESGASSTSGAEGPDPDIPYLKNCSSLMNRDHLEAVALKEFETVEPVSVVLGKDASGKQDSCQYIPLASQLQLRFDNCRSIRPTG